ANAAVSASLFISELLMAVAALRHERLARQEALAGGAPGRVGLVTLYTVQRELGQVVDADRMERVAPLRLVLPVPLDAVVAPQRVGHRLGLVEAPGQVHERIARREQLHAHAVREARAAVTRDAAELVVVREVRRREVHRGVALELPALGVVERR